MENRPREPGTPGETKRGAPSSFCHCRKVQRLRERKAETKSMVREARCWGKARVCATESMSQPRTTLTVSQEASPLLSFFKDNGSLALGWLLGDLRKSSTVCMRMRRTVRRRCVEP